MLVISDTHEFLVSSELDGFFFNLDNLFDLISRSGIHIRLDVLDITVHYGVVNLLRDSGQ
jgi:hypothetical protein